MMIGLMIVFMNIVKFIQYIYNESISQKKMGCNAFSHPPASPVTR